MFAKSLEVQIETPHAILINAKTGHVLFDKKSRESIYPASTTKIASVLYLLKNAGDRLDEVVVCSDDALRIVSEEVKIAKGDLLPPYILELDGTSMKLKRNEKVVLKDLLYGMLLASGNDASNVAAEYLSGDVQTFVRNMNQMSESLGCKNTHFTNPHGLFHPDHKTCAYDMAILTREALNYPLFREMVKTTVYKRDKRVFTQNNALLKPDSKYYYPLAFGIKTGYVRKAKYNLVAGASNSERELIAVLHKSPTSTQRYIDAIVLFEAAFCEPLNQRLMFSKEETSFEKVIPKANKSVIAIIKEDLYLKYYPSEEEEVIAKLDWQELQLPIEKGSLVAKLSLLAKRDGRLLAVEELLAKDLVSKKLIYRMLDGTKGYFLPLILPLLLIGLGVGFVLLVKGRDEESRPT